MKQKRHTTEEIIRILREADQGKSTEAICREQHHHDELSPLEEEVQWDGITGCAALSGAGKGKLRTQKDRADQMLKIRVLEEVNSKKW
jgi:putative transposase